MADSSCHHSAIRSGDDVHLAEAQTNPVRFVADLPENAVLDEVQPVPALGSMTESTPLALVRTGMPSQFVG
jgi:hypothetical protein